MLNSWCAASQERGHLLLLGSAAWYTLVWTWLLPRFLGCLLPCLHTLRTLDFRTYAWLLPCLIPCFLASLVGCLVGCLVCETKLGGSILTHCRLKPKSLVVSMGRNTEEDTWFPSFFLEKIWSCTETEELDCQEWQFPQCPPLSQSLNGMIHLVS